MLKLISKQLRIHPTRLTLHASQIKRYLANYPLDFLLDFCTIFHVNFALKTSAKLTGGNTPECCISRSPGLAQQARFVGERVDSRRNCRVINNSRGFVSS
jgi:hypothetical protein